jgi:hypothetical protein
MRAAAHMLGRTMAWIGLGAVAAVALLACGTAGQSAALPTATRLSVGVATDRPSYRTDQAIGATVTNGGAVTYYARADRSGCTILELQRLVAGAWRDQMPCGQRQQPILALAPHGVEPFTLAPGNSPGDPNVWLPGTYRVALVVGVQSDGADASIHVYSAGFTIAAS